MFAFSESTGFRTAEVALPYGYDFDDRRLRRSSLLWEIDGTLHADPSPEQLRAFVLGRDKAVIESPRSKAATTERFGVPIPSGWSSRTPTLPTQRGGYCASSYSFRCAGADERRNHSLTPRRH